MIMMMMILIIMIMVIVTIIMMITIIIIIIMIMIIITKIMMMMTKMMMMIIIMNFNYKKKLIEQTTCPKHYNLPSQSPMVKISCKIPPLVSVCEHFMLTVFLTIFPLFLTSYKQSPTTWSTDLYMFTVYKKCCSMHSWWFYWRRGSGGKQE